MATTILVADERSLLALGVYLHDEVQGVLDGEVIWLKIDVAEVVAGLEP